MPPDSLRRAWKMRPWMQRLSGLTFDPSIQRLGVDAWISSLRVIRASHFPSLGENRPKPIPATSGPLSARSSAPSSRACASLKMYRTIYVWDLNKSTMTYDQWVSALRRACLRRRKSAPRTGANDCSSWPTAKATDGNKGGPNSRHGSGSPHLPAAAVQMQWYTPTVPNGGRVNPKDMSMTGALPSGKKRQVGLENQIRQTDQNSSWATPMTRDWKDGTATANVDTNGHLGRQAPRSMNNGSASPLTLNPLFVEWLMGWPIGWTDFAPAATAWCHWQRRMRSELSRLLSPDNDEAPRLL